MAKPVYEAIYYGDDIVEMKKPDGRPYYRPVEITWSTPVAWMAGQRAPVDGYEKGQLLLYIFSSLDGNGRNCGPLYYVGKTQSVIIRFRRHTTALSLIEEHGGIMLSFGVVDFKRYQDSDDAELRELEHIFTWTLWEDLRNNKGMFSVPGQGKNGGGAWHILNKGFSFGRKMPKEVLFPWIMIKPHRRRATLSLSGDL